MKLFNENSQTYNANNKISTLMVLMNHQFVSDSLKLFNYILTNFEILRALTLISSTDATFLMMSLSSVTIQKTVSIIKVVQYLLPSSKIEQIHSTHLVRYLISSLPSFIVRI